MHSRSHGTAVTTEASAGRPRPQPSESRKEQHGSGVCLQDIDHLGGAPAAGALRSPSRFRSNISPLLSPERRGVFETRTIFHFPYRRSSSGYFSIEGESLPSSPLSTRVSAFTQTPSPSAQALEHALARVAEEAHYPRATLQGSSVWRPSAGLGPAAGDMQAVEVGQELRRIGDDYNDYIMRGAARRGAAALQNQLPVLHIHQEPALLLCMGLLVLVIVWYFG
ncbi:bcl-2-like protein 11 isoform X1 [Syngnathus typhle]|uniref:bcl-2-like protein 11 isoform X1 n=1 Tax=Syngnathus typhle TaxID=161592 RepID=UPI002A6AFD04|nr:bcl-2-like protein 11 isoform X1 [Syngnathus typhle]XP_061141505.1 bcl-2-like protein 11 isoform X1 [Syngnathus typhle]